MIGKSRMKGEKVCSTKIKERYIFSIIIIYKQVVTTLVPFGPERPKTGLQDQSSTSEDKVEIFWDPPKGEFTKYTLEIDKLEVRRRGTLYGSPAMTAKNKQDSMPCISNIYEVISNRKYIDSNENVQENRRRIENLSYKLTRYIIQGLEPAEAYMVTLGTKTGMVSFL